MLSAKSVKIKKNHEVNQVISLWQNPENLYCAEITEKQLVGDNMKEFINNIRIIFCGDIIDASLVKKKPVFLYPALNFQRNIERLRVKSDREIGNNVLTYLNHLSIHLDNVGEIINLSFLQLNNFLHSVITSALSKITVCGDDIFSYPQIHELIDELDRMSVMKTFCITPDKVPEDIKSLGFLKSEQFRLRIEVSVGFDVSKAKKLSGILNSEKINHEWEFTIISEDTYEKADAFIEKMQLENAEIKPVYTGDNLQFFEDNIYLTEEDLQSSGLSKREVFAHQALNTNNFGKLTITPDGKVYANLNHEPLGTIEDDIRELIYKEMDKGTSWRRIRDMEPCCDCVYQWLCPSPSNYELAIGKPNLCHVKP